MIQLTPYWTDLRPHREQHLAWNTKKRFVAIVAGRGSGKTEIARRKCVIELSYKKPWPNPIYAYCLPTFAQAKKVAWKPLLNLIPEAWIKRNGINLSDMSIETIFGSTLYVMGMDKPQRLEGLQLDGAVLDESSDQKNGVFDLTLVPALTHRNGWCWRIGVPKRSGIGRVDFRAFFERGLQGDPNIDSYMWRSSTVLTEDQISAAKQSLNAQDFDEQFNAEWLDGGGSIYHAYSSENIDDNIRYNPEQPIIVGADFNVDPMCWVLAHKYGEGKDAKIEVFDEIFLKNTNTPATLDFLANKFPEHEAGWHFFCDASTRQRKTSATKTDYLIIKNYDKLSDKYVYFPKKNPYVQDRYNTVNSALRNAAGDISLKVHSRCIRLITDFKLMAYKEGTTDPEDYTGTDVGHMSDGLGYAVMRLMPLRARIAETPGIFTTEGY